MTMNIFGGPDQDLALVPLADLRLDLRANLEEGDIPDPRGLFEEHRAITQIVQDARTRAYAAMHGRPRSASDSGTVDEEEDEDGEEDGDDDDAKLRASTAPARSKRLAQSADAPRLRSHSPLSRPPPSVCRDLAMSRVARATGRLLPPAPPCPAVPDVGPSSA
ncbi:hypothetical protein BD413DRAFT_492015 [Trametes elegans]|nr:hypothetical protein BD413DRAFT_492015 [Trametes elegans]